VPPTPKKSLSYMPTLFLIQNKIEFPNADRAKKNHIHYCRIIKLPIFLLHIPIHISIIVSIDHKFHKPFNQFNP
jgi:hypothetical protein